MTQDIDVTEAIKQLEAIRRSGVANMMTETGIVKKTAVESGFYQLVDYIAENNGYGNLLSVLPHEEENEEPSVDEYMSRINSP